MTVCLQIGVSDMSVEATEEIVSSEENISLVRNEVVENAEETFLCFIDND